MQKNPNAVYNFHMLFTPYVSAVRKYISVSYRRLMLAFSFLLIFFNLLTNFSSFFVIFSQMNKLLDQTRGYEYIYGLATVLKQNRDEVLKQLQSRDFLAEKINTERSILQIDEYLTRIQERTLADPSIYFLVRGIENGVTYIRQQSGFVNAQTDETVKYAATYNILMVYGYIINYADDKMLSSFAAAYVAHVSDVIRSIHRFRVIILTTIVFASAFFVLSALNITRKLVNPIQGMVTAAQEIARGNLDIPDIVPSGTREIQVLEQTLNVMKDNLKTDIQNREDRAALAAELEAARMSALQAQIHPHFLFNTLNIISRTAMQENAEKTQALIQALSGIFRFNLEYRKTVLLSEELDFISQYMHVQQSRFPDRMTYSCMCGCDISAVVIPPFIIQPIVENAVIHGIEQSENGGTVRVTVQAESGVLSIRIADTGVGMSDEQLLAVAESGTANGKPHIGVQNVINRLKLFYGCRAGMEITHNQPRGVVVTLSLPID